MLRGFGIGRFVPCFLLFSDIGSPVAYVYPVGHKSPQQIFERLRVWVDSFYEINHSTLSRWKEIENSIKQTSQALRSSIDKVERWKRDQEDRWKQLRKLSRVLDRLENSCPDGGILKDLSADYNLAWETNAYRFFLRPAQSNRSEDKAGAGRFRMDRPSSGRPPIRVMFSVS